MALIFPRPGVAAVWLFVEVDLLSAASCFRLDWSGRWIPARTYFSEK